MNPRFFLFIAESLIREIENAPDSTHDGAKCRTTYNRAYYAAFLIARDFFDSLDLKIPSGSKCHECVQTGLNNSGNTNLVKISEQLGTLYTGRADADYQMNSRTTENIVQAKLNIELAKNLIALIDAIRNPSSRPPLDRKKTKETILSWAKTAGQPIYPK